MLRGDNGILNRSTEAKFANSIAQFDEQTKLASMAVRTSIEANKVSTGGYIATYNGTEPNIKNYFTGLVNEVAKELGVTALPISSSQSANIETEGYTVGYYLATEGNVTTNGDGYIIIWYTDNSLRSSIDMNSLGQYGLEIISQLSADETENKKIIKNQATLVRVIHIENYKSELSAIGLTGTTGNVEEALNALGGTGSTQTGLNDGNQTITVHLANRDEQCTLSNPSDAQTTYGELSIYNTSSQGFVVGLDSEFNNLLFSSGWNEESKSWEIVWTDRCIYLP